MTKRVRWPTAETWHDLRDGAGLLAFLFVAFVCCWTFGP